MQVLDRVLWMDKGRARYGFISRQEPRDPGLLDDKMDGIRNHEQQA